MSDEDKKLQKKLEDQINSADSTASKYRLASWFLPVFLAIMGVLVGAGTQITKPWNLLLGSLSAGAAAMQKAIEPSKKQEWHTIRKRALEKIQLEAHRSRSDPSPLTNTELHRLLLETKEDPVKVLEKIAAALATQTQSNN